MKREKLVKVLAGRDPTILADLPEHFFGTRVIRLEAGRWHLKESEFSRVQVGKAVQCLLFHRRWISWQTY
jgi:hypothetical protein